MNMEIVDISICLLIHISIHAATYGCPNKKLIHISSIKDDFYDDCVGTDFIQGFLDSFLAACDFQPRHASTIGACTLQCIQQPDCEAMAYNATDGCYVSLQGGGQDPLSDGSHHVGIQNVYIDRDMFKEHIGYFHTAHSRRFSWCSDASQDVFVGDFNGDRLDDLLCHQKRAGGAWPLGKIGIAYNRPGSGFIRGNTWEFEMNWCFGTNHELHIADFNGDGRDDMLCNTKGTNKKIAFASQDGHFADISWQGQQGYCVYNPLFTGDFNGDGRHDWLCKNIDNGKTLLLHATADGTFHGTTSEYDISWCSGSSAELYTTGDFNGDGLADWLCRRPDTQIKMVSLTNTNRTFTGTAWHEDAGFCYVASQKLVIGDVNGDGLSDMVCIDIASGYTWIVLAVESTTVWFGGIVWQGAGWCQGDQLLFWGDFDADGKMDALCKSSNKLCYTTSS